MTNRTQNAQYLQLPLELICELPYELDGATSVKRRMLNLKAKFEGDSFYYSYQRLLAGLSMWV